MSVAFATDRRFRYGAAILVVAGASWLWFLLQWGPMGAVPGAMGLGAGAFVGMWTVMMAAMMLPATAPLVSLYARTIVSRRIPRLAAFAAGYLAVWAAAGVPAYALALLAGRASQQQPLVGTIAASAIFAANGVYQFTPWKDRCLSACRSPLALLLRYASWRGPVRDARAGAHHGAYCLGCCWSLMVLMTAFGVMNLWAMVGLSAVVAAEKLTPHGVWFARLAGVASLILAIAVFWMPSLAPGLHGTTSTMSGMG